MIKNANELELKESIGVSKKPIFVDFHAVWCGPCRALNPLLEEISEKYSGRVDFFKVDVDKNRIMSADFGIKTIPTLVMIENGQVKRTMNGVLDREQIEKFIEGNN